VLPAEKRTHLWQFLSSFSGCVHSKFFAKTSLYASRASRLSCDPAFVSVSAVRTGRSKMFGAQAEQYHCPSSLQARPESEVAIRPHEAQGPAAEKITCCNLLLWGLSSFCRDLSWSGSPMAEIAHWASNFLSSVSGPLLWQACLQLLGNPR